MGHEERTGAASLHGLARVQRERHWTAIMDGALAFTILLWIAGLAVTDFLPRQADAVLPVVIGVMALHRLLVVLEHQFREHGSNQNTASEELVASTAASATTRAA